MNVFNMHERFADVWQPSMLLIRIDRQFTHVDKSVSVVYYIHIASEIFCYARTNGTEGGGFW